MIEEVPNASVVIIVRNGAKTILRQLDALASQQGAPSFEVVVVDNGSTDNTRVVVEDWMRRNTVSVRLIDASARASIPHARNCGLRASRGDLIAFCDADDEVDPTWLRALLEPLNAEPALIAGFKRYRGPAGFDIPDAGPPGISASHPYPFAPTCNLAVPRSVAIEVGGFDESLPRYGFEDVDFCWRVQRAGYPLRYQPNARITYHLSGRATAARKVFLLASGRMAMLRRHDFSEDPPPSLWRLAKNLVAAVASLPYHLIIPGASTRQHHVRRVIEEAGRLAGYWHYWVRDRDTTPRYLET